MIWLFLVANLSSFACVVGAIVLALNHIEGWGWLLLVAVLIHVSVDNDVLIKFNNPRG